eukprot:2712969-Pyramimonas_sp.AAC.1
MGPGRADRPPVLPCVARAVPRHLGAADELRRLRRRAGPGADGLHRHRRLHRGVAAGGRRGAPRKRLLLRALPGAAARGPDARLRGSPGGAGRAALAGARGLGDAAGRAGGPLRASAGAEAARALGRSSLSGSLGRFAALRRPRGPPPESPTRRG